MSNTYTHLLTSILLLCFTGFTSAQDQDFSDIPPSVQPYVIQKSRPNWLKFNGSNQLTKEAFLDAVDATQSGNEPSVFILIKEKVEKKGRTRYVYEQRYKDIIIENYKWVIHEKNNKLFLAQGEFLKKPFNQAAQADLSKDQALIIALDEGRATKYAWEVPSLEQNLKTVRGNDKATYFPKPKLVWLPKGKNNRLQLAYKVKIYSVDPIAKKNYYVHAKTGELLLTEDLLHTGCFEHTAHHPLTATVINKEMAPSFNGQLVGGSGLANYVVSEDGAVEVKATLSDVGYTLFRDDLGPNENQVIHTQNANNNWHYDFLTDFVDADNVWDTDPAAVGAHWGLEQAYNYYLETFDRHSFDDEGGQMINVVHYGQNLVNAYWDGVQMTYGDGDGTIWGALTSLDIIGHEFTHGVTEHNGTGGLNYIDDSGALNESFSDIFGTVIENAHHPDGGDWWIGEDFDLANKEGFRYMADPNVKGHPKTYLGRYWYDSLGDNGGVHFNSGVQNYWFYLLSEGGSGTNEFGQTYDIAPIGMEVAAQIAYYNLTRYMTPKSTYHDAKEGSIDAALLLYPTDLSIANTVEAAWCAVGIGEGCGPTINVQQPAANEVVTAGKEYELTWQSELLSASSKVKIEYATEDSEDPIWSLVSEGVSNNGSYQWMVPSEYSGTVQIRITDDGDPSAGRVSNTDILGISKEFEIAACIAPNAFSGPTTAVTNETMSFTTNITGDDYQWEIDGIEISTTPDLNYTFNEPGIYELSYTVTSTANACINKESRRVYALGENSNGFAIQVGDIENGGGRSYGQEIFKTKEGGFVYTSLFTSLVFKFDALGNLLWTSNALPASTYGNYRMTGIEKSDGNVLIVMGHSETGSAIANDDLLLIELNGEDGTILNNTSRRLSIEGRLMAHQIIEKDNSYIIGGAYQTITDQHVFLLTLDASDLSITKQFWFGDDYEYDYYGDLLPTSDGGYLLGWIQSRSYPGHFGLVKLDENFQEEWHQGLFSNTTRPGLRSRINLLEVPNCGGYIILADADEYANSALLQINSLGNVLWAKRYYDPSPLNGQYIAFQKMVWDGQDGVTLLGINGTKLNSNSYPEAVDYQVLNVGFDGTMNWKRKVTDLDVIIPTSPNYNLYHADMVLTADGGYLASMPGGDGSETHLVKMDALGLDGCVMANTTIEEQDITSSFTINLDITASLTANPSSLTANPNIQSGSNFSFSGSAPAVSVSSPSCGTVGKELIAAFDIENAIIPINTSPMIRNLSRGASTYVWKVNGNPVSNPIPAFETDGTHQISLEASDGNTTTSVSYDIQVVAEQNCNLPCDLTELQARTIEATCPDSDDGQIYTEVISPIGRTFKYELYDADGNLLVRQATGFFTNLATGTYQVKVASDNDLSCVLDLGFLNLVPRVDNIAPKALCLSRDVNVAFVHAAIGVPYNHGNYVNELTAAFGQAWHQLTYETVDPERLFSDSYHYIYLEGSDHNAEELEEFLDENQSLVEEWVAAGNALLINAAPNEGDGVSLGFGGVELVRGDYTDALASTPSLPMFSGPKTPVTSNMSGYPYSKAAVVSPSTLDATRILVSSNGTDLLLQATWGAGTVLFGGMNLTGFHTPSTETYNFKINLHHYLKELAIEAVNSPIPLELDATQTYNLSVSEIDLGSTDDCGLQNVEIDQTTFTCTQIGVQDITLTVTDLANNLSTCVTQIEVISIPTLSQINHEICEGDAYTFQGEDITDEGVYTATYQNQFQCDSIVELTLSILPTVYTQTSENLCAGTTYDFHGQSLTTSGDYSATLSNQFGCDSIVELTLKVLPLITTSITHSICQGEVYDFYDQQLSTGGTYSTVLQNAFGCDSTINLSLSILSNELTQIQESICDGEAYSFQDKNLTVAGIYKDTLENIHQCDSIIELELSVLEKSQTVLSETICQGENFDFGSQTLTAAGIYEKTVQNENGCDSIVSMILFMEDCGNCPDNNIVHNDQVVEKNNYPALETIESSGVVVLDTVTYLAGRKIELQPGFFAAEGSKFLAEITAFECINPGSIIAEDGSFSQSRNRVNLLPTTLPLNDMEVSPNPFRQHTTIHFTLATTQNIAIALYSADGQFLSMLKDGLLPAGAYNQPFSVGNQTHGIFIIVLKTEDELITRKVISIE